MKYSNSVKVFRAFSDEKRLRIIELLCSGEKCACVLLEQLDLIQSGLSYHMKILVESGIVHSRQQGKWTYYKISECGTAHAVALLKELTKLDNDYDEAQCCDA